MARLPIHPIVAVQVAPAHRQRIQPQLACDIAHDDFGDDHSLRPAKAAKRGMALRVELAAVRGDHHILQKIGVIGVKNGPVRNRPGQVGTEAAVRGHGQFQAMQPATVVKTDRVVMTERVAFAGDHEVIVAIQPQLDRALEFCRSHSCPHRQMTSLRLLAAKTATHAAAFHPDGVVVQAQRVRHPVLHFAGVLRAGVHQPLVLLLRQHVGNLAFEVKVFLATDFKRATQRVRGLRQGGLGIAAPDRHRRQHKAAGRQRLADAQNGRQGFDVEFDQPGSAACQHHVVSQHQANHLADMLHRIAGKDRLVPGKGGQHQISWHIGGQNHSTHAGQGQCRRGIKAQKPAMRLV